MSWSGVFRELRQGDLWHEENSIAGVLVHDMDDGSTHEIMIDRAFVEDDGKSFEEGDEIEILIRRVGSNV